MELNSIDTESDTSTQGLFELPNNPNEVTHSKPVKTNSDDGELSKRQETTYIQLRELYLLFSEELSFVCRKYLAPHLDELTISPSIDWDRDKKSLVLFTHAAFENFIEAVSIAVLNYAVDAFINDNEVSASLLYFTWTRESAKTNFPDNSWSDTSKNLFRKAVSEWRQTFLNDVNENNHGIKIKHLNNLLRSVGLELPQKATLKTSLNDLTNLRGEFAHRFMEKGNQVVRITNKKSPENVHRIILESYHLAFRIYLQAIELTHRDKAKREAIAYFKTGLRITTTRAKETSDIFNLDKEQQAKPRLDYPSLGKLMKIAVKQGREKTDNRKLKTTRKNG